MTLSFKQHVGIALVLAACLLFASLLSAWSGPTATAPAGNVPAPINIGTTDQVKDAGLSVNALAVFGSGYVEDDLGVGYASPALTLDVAGTIRLGNGGEVCQAITEGALRYNSSTKKVEYCNGTSWSPTS